MTEHPTAAFADQVQPGMRVSSASTYSLWTEPVLITQIRRVTHEDSIFGASTTTIHFLGAYDDGRPFAYMAGPQMAVLIHDAPLARQP